MYIYIYIYIYICSASAPPRSPNRSGSATRRRGLRSGGCTVIWGGIPRVNVRAMASSRQNNKTLQNDLRIISSSITSSSR